MSTTQSATRVRVTALLSVREELGWSHQEVEFTGSTLRGLLRTLRTQDGASLEQLLLDADGKVLGYYIVLVNGYRVWDADAPLEADDEIVTTEFFRAVAGG